MGIQNWDKGLQNYPNLNQLQRFIAYIIEKEQPEKIILFGSLARGDFNEFSDIDLFLLYPESIIFKEKKMQLLRYVKKSKKLFDLFPYNIDDFNKLAKNPGLFISNALKHTILIYERK